MNYEALKEATIKLKARIIDIETGDTKLGNNAKIPAGFQVLSFLAGTVCALVYAMRFGGGKRSSRSSDPPSETLSKRPANGRD